MARVIIKYKAQVQGVYPYNGHMSTVSDYHTNCDSSAVCCLQVKSVALNLVFNAKLNDFSLN